MNNFVAEKSALSNRITSLIEQFLELELGLFERELNGLRYWHYIRFLFIHEIFAAKEWIQIANHREQISFIQKIAMFFRLLRNGILHGVRHDHKSAELLILNTANKRLENGKYIDVFTDTWLPGISAPYTIWEHPTLWRHKTKNPTPGVFYLDGFLLLALLKQTFLLRFTHPVQDEVSYLLDFAKRFHVELPRTKISQILSYASAINSCCAKKIESKLQEKRPKLIILVNHYDPLNMLITSIAKSHGIYVVELQHGTMGKYHMAYNLKIGKSLKTLPNEIFTFGEFWNETTPIHKNDVVLHAVGWPYFEERLRNVTVDKRCEKIKLLILSQEIIGERLAEIAVELSEKLESSKYEIIFKLHPREYNDWRARYPKLLKAAVTVRGNEDLYRLLKSSDVHIGVYSTAVIESLAFGKKLILVDSYGIHWISDLISSGRALFAKSADDIIKAIQIGKEFKEHSETARQFWEPDSKNKILERIHWILTEHDR